MKTYAKIQNGNEVETVVLHENATLPEGDWRPVVVEGLDFDRAAHRETGRETIIEPSRVVRRIVLAPVVPVEEDYSQAIQAHIETTAQLRGYGNSALLASYVASTVPAWAAEAKTFVTWRDAVWLAAYSLLAAVNAGQAEAPTVSKLIDGLPAIKWPAG